jgi:hypothetical protein
MVTRQNLLQKNTNNMNKLIKSNTDLIIVLLVLASIGLTYKSTMDVKDFVSMVLMVLSYKFGRSQGVDKPVQELG